MTGGTDRTEAAAILQAARARQAQAAAEYRPPDYRAANRKLRAMKGALTRALNRKDADAVVVACRDAVRAWGEPPFNGAWPDDWGHWQRALDTVLDWRARVDLRDLR